MFLALHCSTIIQFMLRQLEHSVFQYYLANSIKLYVRTLRLIVLYVAQYTHP